MINGDNHSAWGTCREPIDNGSGAYEFKHQDGWLVATGLQWSLDQSEGPWRNIPIGSEVRTILDKPTLHGFPSRICSP